MNAIDNLKGIFIPNYNKQEKADNNTNKFVDDAAKAIYEEKIKKINQSNV